MNALAGGGSGITFAALVFTGMPPIIANANTFAATFGYHRRDWLSQAYGRLLARPRLAPLAFIGGLIGGWALLQTDPQLFAAAVPWLLLLATLLFAAGPQLERAAVQLGGARMAIGAFAISSPVFMAATFRAASAFSPSPPCHWAATAVQP